MPEKTQATGDRVASFKPSGPSTLGVITPFDQETSRVDPVTPVSAILGISNFVFDFFNEGGPNNLKPGRSTTQTVSISPPDGTTNGFICLRKIAGQFVTNGGANLTERPLGAFIVDVDFGPNNTLNCTVRLSDSNGDDPIKVYVHGTIVYIR